MLLMNNVASDCGFNHKSSSSQPSKSILALRAALLSPTHHDIHFGDLHLPLSLRLKLHAL